MSPIKHDIHIYIYLLYKLPYIIECESTYTSSLIIKKLLIIIRGHPNRVPPIINIPPENDNI